MGRSLGSDQDLVADESVDLTPQAADRRWNPWAKVADRIKQHVLGPVI